MDDGTLKPLAQEHKKRLEQNQAILKWTDQGPDWTVDYNNYDETSYDSYVVDSKRVLVLGRVTYVNKTKLPEWAILQFVFCRIAVPHLAEFIDSIVGQQLIPPLIQIVVDYYGDMMRLLGRSFRTRTMVAGPPDFRFDHHRRYLGFIWQRYNTFLDFLDYTVNNTPSPEQYRVWDLVEEPYQPGSVVPFHLTFCPPSTPGEKK